MRKVFLVLMLIVSLVGTGVALGATISWKKGTVNMDAATIMRDKIAARHTEVCGTSLVYDSQLIWIARWKAMDMGYRNYFGHKTPEGKYTREFFDRAGIPWRYGTGEILAWNSAADNDSPGMAFNQFMNSFPHRSVIQNCAYERFGVGTFKRADGHRYYAVEFTNITR